MEDQDSATSDVFFEAQCWLFFLYRMLFEVAGDSLLLQTYLYLLIPELHPYVYTFIHLDRHGACH